jgi:uncharacterized metal-binding protein
MTDIRPSCVDCAINACGKTDVEYPSFCPSKGFDLQELPELTALMQEEQNARIYKSAAHSAHVGFREKLDRLQETILFAHGYGAKKIGVASCISYAPEARFAANQLRQAGFEVVGVICKIGHLTCAQTNVPIEARAADTALCNPIYQAQMLNAEQTDLNVVIGLCAGHDALFLKHAEAPCTVMAIKDFKYGKDNAHSLREGN